MTWRNSMKKKVMTLVIVFGALVSAVGCNLLNEDEDLAKSIDNRVLVEAAAVVPEGAKPATIAEDVEGVRVEVGKLDTHREARLDMDDALLVTRNDLDGKNGVIYVDLEGNQTDNTTLLYAFSNKKFVENYWNNPEVEQKLREAADKAYKDTSHYYKKAAFVSSYFNLMDSNTEEFGENDLVTRRQYMEYLYKIGNPVEEIEPESWFSTITGVNNSNIYCQEVDDKCIICAKNETLNDVNYNSYISRFEVVYSLLNIYFPDKVVGSTSEKAPNYSDVIYGGNLALEQGFRYIDEETGDEKGKPYWQAYLLKYNYENHEKAYKDIFSVMAVCKELGLLQNEDGEVSECKWFEAATKGDIINITTELFEKYSEINGYATDHAMGDTD